MEIEEIRKRIRHDEYEITFHAEKERYAEDMTIVDLESAINNGEILEDYPKKIIILLEIHANSNELQYVKENFGNGDFKIMDLSGKIIDLQSNHVPTHLILTNNQT